MSINRHQLPLYKGKDHQVRALKIKEIHQDPDGAAYLTPEDESYPQFQVSAEFMSQDKPKEGGYYVESVDGQSYFVEAKDFTKEYSLLK